jgi:universal stress protein A
MLPKRILVPVDFSESSRDALRYAVRLARKLGASIDAVTVWQPASFVPVETLLGSLDGGNTRTIGDLARSEALIELRTFLATVDHEGVGPIAGRVEIGEPAEIIVRLAEIGDYDLVVMGKHGRTRLRQLAVGSVAERVVRNSPAPVVTVRAQALEPATVS